MENFIFRIFSSFAKINPFFFIRTNEKKAKRKKVSVVRSFFWCCRSYTGKHRNTYMSCTHKLFWKFYPLLSARNDMSFDFMKKQHGMNNNKNKTEQKSKIKLKGTNKMLECKRILFQISYVTLWKYTYMHSCVSVWLCLTLYVCVRACVRASVWCSPIDKIYVPRGNSSS